MNTLLDKDYEHAYNRKKENSLSRGVGFHLTKEEYIAIMKNREVLTCGYTQRKLVTHRGFDHQDYPEMDRIDPDKPYSKNNILFCCSYVHKLKTNYVELGKSRKGLSHKDLCILRSIDKVLNQPDILGERLKPYEVIYDRVAQRKQEVEQKVKKAEQKVIKQTEEEKQAKIAQKFKEQQHFAKYYHQKAEEFSKLGVVMQISIKEMRDILRITKDAITKEPFNDIWDKHLWVVDKTRPVARGNILVCKLNTQEALDHLSKGDSMVLKTAMKNLNKIL
ncbi:putative coil containing protein [Vibrio phage 501E54-1]|nr:putative coil containing protein [Vibrio phage 501E54-1]